MNNQDNISIVSSIVILAMSFVAAMIFLRTILPLAPTWAGENRTIVELIVGGILLLPWIILLLRMRNPKG
jgi:hypothetical protein